MADLTAQMRALAALQRRFVTVLGYGPSEAAHALCLRDSGVDVRIGMPVGSDWSAPEADGFIVEEWTEAAEEADLFLLAGDGTQQLDIVEAVLTGTLVPGDCLVVVDGFAVRYGALPIPEGVDVVMVTPVGGIDHLRREFVEGRGVPVMTAVDRDATGSAATIAMGYAAALGGMRAGIVETTVAEGVDAMTLGATAIADAGLPTLMETAFRTLVDNGVSADVAYLATVQEASAAVERLVRVGPSAYRDQLSPWRSWVASNVDLLDGAAADELEALLPQLRDGSLAAQLREQRIPTDDELEVTGEKIRAMMPWLRHQDDAAGRRWR